MEVFFDYLVFKYKLEGNKGVNKVDIYEKNVLGRGLWSVNVVRRGNFYVFCFFLLENVKEVLEFWFFIFGIFIN